MDTAEGPIGLADLAERHGKMVAALCRRVLGDTEDARDAAQEVWLAALKALPGYRGDSKASTWLWAIAYRTLLKRAKTLKRYRFHELANSYDMAEFAAPADQSELRAWARRKCDQCLQGVLFCLGPVARLVFVFHWVVGLSHASIAPCIGRSLPATRQIASRARRSVAAFMDGRCAYRVPGGKCRCGMERHLDPAGLRAEYAKVAALRAEAERYRLAEDFLPPLDQWKEFLPKN